MEENVKHQCCQLHPLSNRTGGNVCAQNLKCEKHIESSLIEHKSIVIYGLGNSILPFHTESSGEVTKPSVSESHKSWNIQLRISSKSYGVSHAEPDHEGKDEDYQIFDDDVVSIFLLCLGQL